MAHLCHWMAQILSVRLNQNFILFEETTKMISTGFILRQYREFYRIKQWELAAQLGFSSSVLCDIEKGRRPLTIDIREKAEEVFREQQTHCDSMPEIITQLSR